MSPSVSKSSGLKFANKLDAEKILRLNLNKSDGDTFRFNLEVV
jgi:hypothetical protein